MSMPVATSRLLVLAALATMVATAGGCRWLRGPSPYAMPPESRPLEVPPDLDSPRVDPSATIPAVAARPASAGSAPAQAAAMDSFVLEGDTVDSAWRRLGLALGRIDGVEIVESAQLLGAYNVRYEGQTFLVRAQAEGGNARVTAVGAEGRALSGGASARLLGILRQRLR